MIHKNTAQCALADTRNRAVELMALIDKIVSGGQTGVDRAALDFARQQGIPCGGWCPQGRRAEDGVLGEEYPLQETPSAVYEERTLWNVRDSQGTLILNEGPLNGGTALTAVYAEALRKPCLVVSLEGFSDPEPVHHWLGAEKIRVLNVAGPRESKHPGIYDRAFRCLGLILIGDSH